MFPDWFTKPESLFRTALWVLGPFFTWYVGKAVIRRVEDWHAAQSLEVARTNLKYYRRKLENPPSLFEQVALIVYFLPVPIALIFMMLVIQNPPIWMPYPISPRAFKAFEAFRSTIYFINYLLFGVLGVYGVQAAYRLRHGEEKYVKNYRAEVRKRLRNS